jgi:hypothetical protein
LRGAVHNLSVRLKFAVGQLRRDVGDGGHALFENYRAMATANGVAPGDPALARCSTIIYAVSRPSCARVSGQGDGHRPQPKA